MSPIFVILFIGVVSVSSENSFDMIVQPPAGITTRQVRIGDNEIEVPEELRNMWDRLSDAIDNVLKERSDRGWMTPPPSQFASTDRLADLPLPVGVTVGANNGRLGDNPIVAQSFITWGIVPSIIDRVPRQLVNVVLADNAAVILGNPLRSFATRNAPVQMSWAGMSPAKMYTIAMVDAEGGWLHWLVVNVRGNDFANGDIIFEWTPSGPQPGSGQHRYTFLVFEQPGPMTLALPVTVRSNPEGRGEFPIRKFAREQALGRPVAGNFFLAECDDYTPQVYVLLGLDPPQSCDV